MAEGGRVVPSASNRCTCGQVEFDAHGPGTPYKYVTAYDPARAADPNEELAVTFEHHFDSTPCVVVSERIATRHDIEAPETTEPPREMVEVGVEGDHFHRHFEGAECAKAGCVPVTPEILAEIKGFEDAQRKRFESYEWKP